MNDIKIFIASHKPYWMPDDEMYVPIHVGSAGKADIGFLRDDSGDNISSRNSSYCELTGMYWAWKNSDSNYVGLAHYRRHFADRRPGRTKQAQVAGREYISAMLEKCDLLLPTHRNYFIENNWNQYVHAHHEQGLVITREILSENHPDYLSAFDEYMKSTKGHRFNMFIMKREMFNAYCEWLFPILFELESRLDTSSYSTYELRVYGFIAERLLDVWVIKNQLAYLEIPYVFLEKQNWLVKGANFLKRKLNGKAFR